MATGGINNESDAMVLGQRLRSVPVLKTLEIEMNTWYLVQIFNFLMNFPFIPSLKPGIMLEFLPFITTQPLLKLHF